MGGKGSGSGVGDGVRIVMDVRAERVWKTRLFSLGCWGGFRERVVLLIVLMDRSKGRGMS
jgi:hypothetical protein